MATAIVIGCAVISAPAKEAAMTTPSPHPDATTAVKVTRFLPDRSLTRVGRPVTVTAVFANTGDADVSLGVRLTVPTDVDVTSGRTLRGVELAGGGRAKLSWTVSTEKPMLAELKLYIQQRNAVVTTASVPIRFLPAIKSPDTTYVPEPEPAPTEILIGAHHCPLWEAEKPGMWRQILKHPERVPALGFYAQENPEVADWETLWAVEHGISFFIYCWYRTSQGKPVEMMFGSAIHEALFKSRHADKLRFTIMWENQRPGVSGVSDEQDLFGNLMPFWMEHYFTHPSYLEVDNRPVLFVYRPEFLVRDLGSEEAVRAAFEKMRDVCRGEGFDGMYILGEYRGLDRRHVELMKRLGLDHTFAYCWPVPDSPPPQQAIDIQMSHIRKTEELGILPQVVTLSQAWSGWHDEGSIWKIPPEDYKQLLRRGKAFVEGLSTRTLSGRMLLLDNWNEWGEGHYIAPYTEYGFGYVDAVREVFSSAPNDHLDLLPEDIGMGPYDTPYREWLARDDDVLDLLAAKAHKEGASQDGLIGWWAFDEEPGCPVALDYAGNRLGGRLRRTRRAPGIDGNALVCDGGAVVVPSHRLLSVGGELTIECWVKTDVAGQDNRWIVNRVLSGGIDTGYRLGILQGKPCFEVPQTAWSHHLTADTELPTGRWVHLAGTFDATTMRLYVDGIQRGEMERPGPVRNNDLKLVLGSYEEEHVAHFEGLLDEVRIYARCLSPDDIRQHIALTGRPEDPRRE